MHPNSFTHGFGGQQSIGVKNTGQAAWVPIFTQPHTSCNLGLASLSFSICKMGVMMLIKYLHYRVVMKTNEPGAYKDLRTTSSPCSKSFTFWHLRLPKNLEEFKFFKEK